MRKFNPRNAKIAAYEDIFCLSKSDAEDLDLIEQLEEYLERHGDIRTVIIAILGMETERINRTSVRARLAQSIEEEEQNEDADYH